MFLNYTAIYNLSTILNRPILEINGWKLDFYFFETFISGVFLLPVLKLRAWALLFNHSPSKIISFVICTPVACSNLLSQFWEYFKVVFSPLLCFNFRTQISGLVEEQVWILRLLLIMSFFKIYKLKILLFFFLQANPETFSW